MWFRCAGRDAIIDDVRVKRSILQKMLGLRFVASGRAWFPFNQETRAPIDMVGMRFPLDVAFLDDEGRVQEIVEAEPVSLHPGTWKTYRPRKPFRSVLEVERGLFDRLDIHEGCRLEPVHPTRSSADAHLS